MSDERDPNARREALKVLIGAGAVALCGAVAVPAAVFIAAPVKRGGGAGERWVRTLRLDALREGEPKKVAIVSDQRDAWSVQKDVELGAVWLVRRGDAVSALSVTCPHLGCAIDAARGGAGFACPCHTSQFAADGTRIAGPSPRNMDALAARVTDGVVEVDFRKFRIGVPQKEELPG